MLTGRNTAIVWLGAGLLLAGCSSGQPTALASQPPTPAPPAAPQLSADEQAAVKQDNVVVLFQPGSDQITPQAARQLDVAARLFRDVRPVVMFAIGYSDTNGTEFGNLVLAGRRARAVKQALVERGIPADRLLIQALGESELANTAQPLSPENRRALVKWRMS